VQNISEGWKVSLIRNSGRLGPYRRTIPRVLWWSWGGGAVSYERGTPEPWRTSPRQAQYMSEGRKVSLVTHSMGGLVAKCFMAKYAPAT